MKFADPNDVIQLTPLWKGDRFADGRPRVPDQVLRRIAKITMEGIWGPLYWRGYKFQFEGEMKRVHSDKIMVGRAVTAVMVPQRPDLHETLLKYGHEEENRRGFFNQWVIDSLQEDDIVVVDLFDKIISGTYVGGNLSTAIAARTKRGGAVIWGGIRDIQQIEEIKSIQIYYRGYDLTGIGEVTMVGMNCPCRIGKAICMPGDVVMGTSGGVFFVPPHLAEECVEHAEKIFIKDMFGFLRLDSKTYTTAQIDSKWTKEILTDFLDWVKKSAPAEYQHLTWEEEEKELAGGDQVKTDAPEA
jgi:regulator of RNase E activity RraA